MKAVALEVPAIVRAGKRADLLQKGGEGPPVSPTPEQPKATTIVTTRRKRGKFAHLLDDLTPEESNRRADAADAMFQDMKRRIAAGEVTTAAPRRRRRS